MTESRGARSAEPPEFFKRVSEEFPDVIEAHGRLGAAVRAAGPLTSREVALVKLAIATGARMEGAVHAHARTARAEGVEERALEQVAVLASPTIGFPNTMAALTWIRDEGSEE
ncbi:MAG: carboxymuconolactone decarboxylase family protein [Gemmatimonadetes bacterium]|nr:carboxymuconolactone decarboxylase family protein [Gemmatimonadota bacterium]NIR77286.1 carboxymuconolactone decarboxylase family protein [Gemmatimonadota bacterium]NIT85804.1 carboxymuconolactone decarboxylase family protein [Gemmatimonadota bacterium]NIU29630.1 carboxymuconolactone decarboxylase family protein [Gemmatimonadota bacterium]NIU34677.1 carboxymuconolactone decarboxylase family protein [Gemmatimonadota bacterium]